MRKPFTGEADERRRWWVGGGASSAEEVRAEEREVATVRSGEMAAILGGRGIGVVSGFAVAYMCCVVGVSRDGGTKAWCRVQLGVEQQGYNVFERSSVEPSRERSTKAPRVCTIA